MKRQRGRNRGGGGGGKQPQNANRAFDSNGPEGVKVRGNAQHVFEKYQQLARDANASGDRVLGENYLQHAEHYFRLLRAMQPQRPASEILGRDSFSSGFDIDFEDEGAQAQAEAADEAAAEAGEQPAAQDGGGEQREQRWENRNRDDRNRDDRNRDGGGGRDRDRGERFENRDGGGGGGGRRDRWRDRDDRSRDDRPRGDDRPRDDRPRAERDDGPRRERDDRPRFDRDRDERRERDPMPVVEPQGSGFGGEERPSPVLRDAEGGQSQAPAFLQPRAAEPRPEPRGDAEEGGGRKRRRRPRSFEGGGEGPPPGGETEEV